MRWLRGRRLGTLVTASASLLIGGTVVAEEEQITPASESRLSGAAGVEAATHFVSYGTDVWGRAGDWGNPSVFAWSEITMDLDLFDVTTGAWFDLNDDAESPIGGWIQEVDWYAGVGFDVEQFRIDLVYQAWHYPIGGSGQVEEIFDVVVGFDDSDMIVEGFALNPSVIVHNRLSGGGGGGGTAFVLGAEPSFRLIEHETMPVDLSFPVEVAFGTGGFYEENGYGYSAVGATLGFPLEFIPADYGQWSLAANTTYYMTDTDAIGNPRDDFITGTVGLSLAF